jgi:NitT/TauT family transport system substrate-binding protein
MIARRIMGARAEWKLFGTGPAIINAFEKGEIDLAYIGLPPAIIGIDKGVDIICVAGGHVEGTVISGGRQFKGFPEIIDLDKILEQLVGHKLGVPGKGSIHDVIISESLRTFHLDKEIRIIHFQWADQVLEALHNGQVSAAVGTPALAVAAMHYTKGRILYPPSKLWPNNPSYGILVHRGFLDRERETVEEFLHLHEEATSFLRNKPSEAARIISDYVGIVDEAFVLDTLKVSPKYCACLTNEYISATMEFVKTLKELGHIDRDITGDQIFETSLIEKIHPGKDHYSDGISAV